MAPSGVEVLESALGLDRRSAESTMKRIDKALEMAARKSEFREVYKAMPFPPTHRTALAVGIRRAIG